MNALAKTKNKLVRGMGINDYPFSIGTGSVRCPHYITWKNMLTRCTTAEQTRRPSYSGTQVDPAWLSFTAFREWSVRQHWEGRHLDKDLRGYKLYGPDTCLYITREINLFFTSSVSSRTHGVRRESRTARPSYRAQIYDAGKLKSLGTFDTADAAYAAWRFAKIDSARRLAMRSPIDLQEIVLQEAQKRWGETKLCE